MESENPSFPGTRLRPMKQPRMSARASPSHRPSGWSALARLLLWLSPLPALLAATGGETLPATKFADYLGRLGYEAIPLRRSERNQLTCRGQLNGKDFTFIVDTGAPYTAVHTTVARRCKTLGEMGAKLKDSFFGTIEETNVVLLEKLKLGRAEFYNQPAWALDLNPDFRAQRDSDCLLGADFLFRNHGLIDCLEPRLYVRAGELPTNAQATLERSLRQSDFRPVSLEASRELRLALPAQANGESLRLLLDTGAFWTILDHQAADRLHLRARTTTAMIVGVRQVGSSRMSLARLPSLRLGDLTLHDVRVGVARLATWGIGVKADDATIDGILGNDQLGLNSAVVDCRGLKLWLKPAPPAP